MDSYLRPLFAALTRRPLSPAGDATIDTIDSRMSETLNEPMAPVIERKLTELERLDIEAADALAAAREIETAISDAHARRHALQSRKTDDLDDETVAAGVAELNVLNARLASLGSKRAEARANRDAALRRITDAESFAWQRVSHWRDARREAVSAERHVEDLRHSLAIAERTAATATARESAFRSMAAATATKKRLYEIRSRLRNANPSAGGSDETWRELLEVLYAE